MVYLNNFVEGGSVGVNGGINSHTTKLALNTKLNFNFSMKSISEYLPRPKRNTIQNFYVLSNVQVRRRRGVAVRTLYSIYSYSPNVYLVDDEGKVVSCQLSTRALKGRKQFQTTVSSLKGRASLLVRPVVYVYV